MFDIEKWQETAAYFRKNKLRTFLTALGVACGIFILVALLGLGEGFNNSMRSNIADAATNSAVFWCNKTTKPYKGLPANRFFNFKNEDLEILKQRIPVIEHITPEVNGWSGNADFNTKYKDKKGSFRIKGASPDYFSVNTVSMIEGRNLGEHDVKTYAKVAVIGPRVKEILFPMDESPVGKYIEVNGMHILVVGTFNPESNNFGNNRNAILMPYTTLQRLYGYGDKVWAFIVAISADANMKDVEKEIFQIISERHQISPDDNQAIGSVNLAEIFEKISAFFTTITVLLWVIGMGTLIIGTIGVSNIMLVVVKERTKELGIKRALGATPAMIIKQIMFESILLTSFAGFWGFVLGVAVVEGVNIMIEKMPDASQIPLVNPQVDFNIALAALGILVVFGALAGLLPAQRAVSIKPIDALRDE